MNFARLRFTGDLSRRSLLAATLALASVTLGVAADVAAQLPPSIAQAKRIVFLGDSITYAGTYVDFVELALRQIDPAWPREIIDAGLPSETVSGLSEPGHAGGKFPRPDLHERLARVLTQAKPDLVFACYGMNDGIYHPFSEERFATFSDGLAWLREQCAASGAAILHVTPPVFDPQPIAERVLPAGQDGYARPFAGYDDVLARYSDWLLGQRARGWTVLDVHGPMQRELAARRERTAGFFFAKDGVHPDRLGHAVIARAILAGLALPSRVSDAPMTWAAEPESEALRLIRTRRKLLSDAWLTATRHQRPGMAEGLPLAAATRQAAELDAKIRALVSAR